MRIAIITMQKDEDILLDKWLAYHGSLFGNHNLYVFDNGSVSAVAKARLHDAETAGVNVKYEFSEPQDFENKGKIVAQCMESLKDQYDFFVPIDTDEFLDLPSDQPLRSSHNDFMEEFKRLATDAEHQYYRISKCFNNIAHTTSVLLGKTKKLIVKSGDTFELDGGYHLYDWTQQIDTTANGKIGNCNFAHIHFHNRDFQSLLTSAREKLKMRIPNFRGHTLDTYAGHGRHVAPYFAKDPADYGGGTLTGAFDIKPEWERRGLGEVPYSSARSIASTDIDKILDPVNLHYIQSKGDYTVEELKFVDSQIGGKKSLLQYGAGSTALLACERGLKVIRVIEPSIDLISRCLCDNDYRVYTHLGRLAFINDFSVDLRMKDAVKKHVPSHEFEDYLQHVHAVPRYDAVIISGQFKAAVAARLYERCDELGACAGSVIYVSDDESQLRQLNCLFEVSARVGRLALISPVAGGRAAAQAVLKEVKDTYIRRPNGAG